jgi:hypothetical protein
MISIEKDGIAPYLSVLLAKESEKTTIEEIYIQAKSILTVEYGIEESNFSNVKKEKIGDVGEVVFSVYEIKKPPSWSKITDLENTENHVIVIFKVGEYYAFYFSEKGTKDRVRPYFSKGIQLRSLKPVSISHLYYNFINDDRVKMLWLSDISGKSKYKADSKVLSGDSVADTLDPLLDQSYMMSAARTSLSSASQETTIGVNPFKSSIWRGPCSTWKDFENRVVEILDKINSNSGEKDRPIGILAYPILDVSNIEKPYDFVLIDYELLPADNRQRDLLSEIHEHYRIETTDVFSKNVISLDVYYEEKICGSFQLKTVVDDYLVSFQVTPNYVQKLKSHAQKFERIFRHPNLVKCWFETGHAIVGGMVFKTEFRDVSFNNFLWADFENYDIYMEKPLSNGKLALSDIGKKKSLFCWVKNFWNSVGIDNAVDQVLINSESPTGWLYCDDGAAEKADFIHFFEFNDVKTLTFIHIKAAKKTQTGDRNISVGAHDIVVNQAIKNLRYCDRKNLVNALETRVSAAKSKQCWRNDKPINALEFIKEIKNTPENNKLRTRVVVIQPHTIRQKYESSVDSNVKKQLNTILVSAESAIRSSGADFYVIGTLT